jgi:hypothetical protein
MIKSIWSLAAAALVTMLAMPAEAQIPTSWVHAGMLTCQSEHRVYHCRPPVDGMPFRAERAVPPQIYEGALNMLGLNVGVSAGGVLGWAVYAPTSGAAPGALAGEYIGASGDIGLGGGVGANVLVGGSGRTIALQPLSLEGSVSINAALGVSALHLRPAF